MQNFVNGVPFLVHLIYLWNFFIKYKTFIQTLKEKCKKKILPYRIRHIQVHNRAMISKFLYQAYNKLLIGCSSIRECRCERLRFCRILYSNNAAR